MFFNEDIAIIVAVERDANVQVVLNESAFKIVIPPGDKNVLVNYNTHLDVILAG